MADGYQRYRSQPHHPRQAGSHRPLRQEPPRVVDPVENFWDFCHEVDLYSADRPASAAMLIAEFAKVRPHATPEEQEHARGKIFRILGLPL